MNFRYGSKWNNRLQCPIDEIGEAAARERGFAGWTSVTRMSDTGRNPKYTILVGPNASHVRVHRYDAAGSVIESYDWGEVPGRPELFLDNHKVWVYGDDVSEPQGFKDSVAHKAWVFFQDGTATCRETIKGMPEVKITRYRDLDMSGHWRERPAWGDWDRFGEHPEPVLTT